ncbi:amine oxidase [flavin-containing]-like isoform X2 [Pecten maximus]|uniref:amine oxidase [flavin-containing]-like isoform X2 n=1 Tax=Pecten maximus TaxID=6579 RepID=UPI00145857CF|nr:amine oxidase [flavin-containing]-like isoform X2 [Pecten maximus]
MTASEVDVVVIGAGLSGLSAAKLLDETGLSVVVLEARDRVGGRTFTEHNDTVNYVDFGGAYVGPTQNRILRLADEFGVETYLTNEVEDLVYYKHGKSYRFQDAFPPMGSFLATLDMNNIFRKMDTMGEEIPADAPWMAPHAEEWDSMTVQEFFDKNVWTKEVHYQAADYVRLNVTCEPYECSLLWFLWYTSICGFSARIQSTENGAQERKFVGGSQQISKCMAKKLGKDKVLLSHPVCKISQNSNGAKVTDIHGNHYQGRYVIVATPLPLQNKITYEPSLPALRNQLIQRVPMGSVIKTFVYYKTPFWREKGYCGSSAIVDDEGIIGFSMDDVKPGDNHDLPALMGFILADKARTLCSLTKEERKQRISKLYSKVFQSQDALHPVHYEEKNWMEEQWSGGCYTVMMPPGLLTKFGRELRKPIDRIHFAGTETATQWSGYMEGAVQAGERAAREILFAEHSISESEIWKDEPENQRVKARPFHTTFWERNAPSVPAFFRIIGVTSVLTAAAAGAFFHLNKK